jgi:hypothetical protein
MHIFNSKLLLFSLLCLILSLNVEAQKKGRFGPFQKKPKDKATEKFMATQWWLGARFGGNWTQAKVEERFTPFSAIPGNLTPQINYEKTYRDFKELGAFSGVVVTLFHKGFSVSLQPNYRRQRFSFTNQYLWLNPTNPDLNLVLDYDQEQKLDYIEIPLFIRYDILQSNLRPYVQLGGYYATLVNANLSIKRSGLDQASGFGSPFTEPTLDVGNPDYFIKTSMGIMGGIGVNWDVWNVRLFLDGNYKLGLHNIANQNNRYIDNRLASIGYAPDNFKLRNIEFSFGILFPLRYLITKNYRAVD